MATGFFRGLILGGLALPLFIGVDIASEITAALIVGALMGIVLVIILRLVIVTAILCAENPPKSSAVKLICDVEVENEYHATL